MRLTFATDTRRLPRLGALASSLALAALWLLPTGAAAPALGAPARTAVLGVTPVSKPNDSATLVQCLTSESQQESSATFAGEMDVIAGTARMEMRIDVLERAEGEAAYHTVNAPGLGVWRSSAPGVKVYRYLKQVTNLAGPAFYRAAVRFRWLSAKGRLIDAAELHTRRCEQPYATSAPTLPTTPTTPITPSPGTPAPAPVGA